MKKTDEQCETFTTAIYLHYPVRLQNQLHFADKLKANIHLS